jgi:hypothetical protein
VAWPDFLGIGVPRAGSTWLYRLMESHPDVWVPAQRTEVHFFDRYFDRGFDWYAQFFPQSAERGRYRAIGEYTPAYLFHPQATERIQQLPSARRFIVSLRHPVQRAVSYYQFRKRIDNYRGSFEDFIKERPYTVEMGFYARPLRRFVDAFGAASLLVLVFEDAVRNVDATKQRLGSFLGIDPKGFADAGEEKVNSSYLPRHRRLYHAAFAVGRWLRHHDLYGPIAWAERVGLKRWVSRADRAAEKQAPPADALRRLADAYAPDIAEVERLLGIDLRGWKTDDQPERGTFTR